MAMMTPKEIVHELSKYIVGQEPAKRAVAVALRNRWRRQRVAEPLRSEIAPKNILMIGPTGVGKTEIARRLARLADAPFIKVEATKFTEVGYVGRDVDSIIRDLTDIAVKQTREAQMRAVRAAAADAAEERLLDVLLTPSDVSGGRETSESLQSTRQRLRKRLREGQLDEKEIEIDVVVPTPQMEVLAPPGMQELSQQIQGLFQNLGTARRRPRKTTVREALRTLSDEEAAKLLNEEEIRLKAIEMVQSNGIVFIDEIDKIANRSEVQGADVSRQGVQRDLLPLVEGTAVNTKFGMVHTDHILFIASGAFHFAKPSDLMPELQGRFPIRVELDALSIEDFERILTQTDACLTRQYQALMATDDVALEFTPDGVTRLAQIACTVNERTENIGARRLHTVMEKLLEEIAFDAGTRSAVRIVIDAAYVDTRLGDLATDDDLARYIL
ncbi:MAG TPA: ATP-dependent protease ATPase subunit HslU [Burkholderiaceae bacterium]|nr:ATP-dependent protease ATPase subunit HslU [Burkholderiaceae bacterium]